MTSFIEGLHEQYVDELYRYLLSLTRNHHLAEEITQETFYRAYLYLHTEKIGNEKAWLFKVGYHTYIDMLRKNKRIIHKDPLFFKQLQTEGTLIEEQYEIKETITEVLEKISTLPYKQEQAILLCDFHDFSYEEAAEILHVSHAYFKILLFRARQTVRTKRSNEDE